MQAALIAIVPLALVFIFMVKTSAQAELAQIGLASSECWLQSAFG
jgi:hypothetical protein